MSEERQMVRLEDGSFDGRNFKARLPPQGLRLATRDEDHQWAELYLYADSRTAEDPELGTIPVMRFQSRGEID